MDANAQTKKISLQGFLKDANGKAVADGIQALTFKIYDTASGGTALWSEDQSLKVVGGVYAAQLGTVKDISTLAWNVPYFVGVTVQGTELSPLTELTYAPYSFGTNKAEYVVCSGAVGDVKYSILNSVQFASVNGKCWVPMDGRDLDSTDRLRKITGLIKIPDGSGLFIRNHEFKEGYDPDRNVGTAIASFQGDNNKQHSHTGTISTAGEHTHAHNANATGGIDSYGLAFMDGKITENNSDDSVGQINIRSYKPLNINNAGSHSHTVTVNDSGGSETRPKNIDFYVYIRIN